MSSGYYPQPVKRDVFISYHHRNDQGRYNSFSYYFSDQLGIFHDDSLDRQIDSENASYLNRKIRDEYIFGTSITIVLCGRETYMRRWVDWEIHSTLEHEHALLGVILPEHTLNERGEILVPDRLAANIHSGYAHWIHWTESPDVILQAINIAIFSSSNKELIENSKPKMMRSLS